MYIGQVMGVCQFVWEFLRGVLNGSLYLILLKSLCLEVTNIFYDKSAERPFNERGLNNAGV